MTRCRPHGALLLLPLLALLGAARGALNVSLTAPCLAAASSAAASCPGAVFAPAAIGACLGSAATLARQCGVTGLATTSDAAAPPACALCGSAPLRAACGSALEALLGDGALAPACRAPSDELALTLLREQGRVTCARQAAPGEVRRWGRMSMAGLTQCTSCGVIACPPGHWCPGGGAEPLICPAGSFCAGGAHREPCPAGSYCPERSSEPLRCRGIAHCPAGAFREVVWVPLFVCLALLVALVAARGAVRAALTRPGGGGGGAKQQPAPAADGGAPPAAAALPPVPRIGLVFESLRLVTRGNVRMDDVSGVVAAGRVTAIMGGSGAGKTTLANLLLGKETPDAGRVTARVAPALGAPPAAAFPPFAAPLRRVSNAVGLVPQVDVMHRELTVRQVVAHSAWTRLPGAWSAAAKAAHVTRVLGQMALTRVQAAVVGSESAPGISSGEVKRTNIAIELAAHPALLVLDEPTTGLDATAAFEAMRLLRRTCREDGRTVLCIIHQPREEILGACGRAVAWSRGGRVVSCLRG